MLQDGAWLRHAAHANAMAQKLAAGIRALRVKLLVEAEVNAVFAELPSAVFQGPARRGWHFHDFIGAQGCRLMCSWDTREETSRLSWRPEGALRRASFRLSAGALVATGYPPQASRLVPCSPRLPPHPLTTMRRKSLLAALLYLRPRESPLHRLKSIGSTSARRPGSSARSTP